MRSRLLSNGFKNTVIAAAAWGLGGTCAVAQPAPPGATLKVTATVQGSQPTGTVTFSTSGISQTLAVVGGVSTFNYKLSPKFTGGSYTVIATYNGDSDNSPSTGSTIFTVLGTTTTVLTANPEVVKQGKTTTLSAAVTSSASSLPAPTGTVEFLFNGDSLGTATISGGVATLKAQVTGTIPPGTYIIEAKYGGDADHLGSSGSTEVTVTK